MADAPDLVGFFENRSMFIPGGRVEDIVRVVVQKTQAIIRSPTAAGGIDDENIAVALEHLRPFANGHGDAFPWLGWRCNHHAGSADGRRVAHGRDVDVLFTVAFARPA